MKILPFLKGIITYKEPKDYYHFELLEDEQNEIMDKQSPGGGSEAKAFGGPSSGDSKNSGDSGKSKDIVRSGFGSGKSGNAPQETADTGEPAKDKKSLKGMSFEEWNNKRAPQGKSAGSGSGSPDGSDDSDGSGGSDQEPDKSDSENEDSLSANYDDNLKRMKKELNYPQNQDVVIREFKILQKCKAFLIFIDGMADKATINDFILRQLMDRRPEKENEKVCLTDFIQENLLAANQIAKLTAYGKIVQQVLNGLTAVFVDGVGESILVETRGYPSRGVTEPMTESVIQGPQEAFVENLRTNLSLVRKIIKSKDLITEITPVGKIDQINCAIVYMKEIVNPKIVREVKRRVNNLDTDFAIGDGVLDQLIEDHPFSLFPQIISTERPDRTAAFLMDGKVAIICDGTPFASIVPTTFFNMFHTSEDATIRWQYATFLRYIRAVASFFAALLPGLYVALTLYHKEMIPTELLASLHKARENVPFPTIVEVLLLEISFEIIREAGVRVPGVIGQTLGIIGAIVLGQAAVAAGLVSPVLIIVVAITGLGSFTIPNYSLAFAIRIIRFVFIFLGAMAGFYGIAAGLFVFGSITASMKSFGVPYFSPIAPKTKSSPDVINKAPAWMQKQRPDFLNTKDRRRGGEPVRKWTTGKGGEKKA